MTEPTRIQPIVLNAPDTVIPEPNGPLKGETIASVYLDGSGLVPNGSCPIKFDTENYVNVECTTAMQLAAFQERLQKARDGFLYDANKDPHDGKKQVIVTQAEIDRAVEVAKDMILKTGSVSRAEVFKQSGIVANAGEFELIFRWRGFDLNTLTKGGLEDLLETNRTRAAEVFEANLRGAFKNNSNHAMVVKFWDGDGDLATRNDQYWLDGAIFDAALAVIDGNLKALSPSSEPAAAVTATADATASGGAQPPSPRPSPIKGEGKKGEGKKGEGDKSDGGIDLGFWDWSGVVAWGLAGVAALFRPVRQRVVHAVTTPPPPAKPHDRKVILSVNLAYMSAHLRERLVARFFDYWGYFDERYNVLQSNDRMRGILYDLAQCTSDEMAVDYLLRVAAFAQNVSPGELLARLEKATGGQELALAEQAVYFLHLIAKPDVRVETLAQYEGAEFVKLADGLKAPPSPQPSPIEGEGKGVGPHADPASRTSPSPLVPVPSVAEGGEAESRASRGSQGEGNTEARLDEIGEDWFVDEYGRKGAAADGPPPLPAAEAAEPPSPQPSPIKGEGKEGGAIQVPSPLVGEGKGEGEPAKKAGAAGTPKRRTRRYPAGTHPAVGAGAAAAAEVPTSAPATHMPTSYSDLVKDLNLDTLAGNLGAAKLTEAIVLGISGSAATDPRFEALEMQVWVLKEWMEEAKVADPATAMREFLEGYFRNEGRLDVRSFVEQTQVKAEKAKARKAEIRSRFEEVERKAREHIESERARRKAGK